MRRFFNRTEKAALYMAADGKCGRCGNPLQNGWHADHVTPFALNGATDVVNGQALCPKCNLKKGKKTVKKELRVWQRQALDRYVIHNSENFLCVACPAAGKTTWALHVARMLLDSREIERVIVVVPTSHLRAQWAKAGLKFNIYLDDKFVNGNVDPASDYDGVVVTYSAIASMPLVYRRMSASKRTLVIFDEIHHVGEDVDKGSLRWGPAVREAFEVATRRLMLSGTPFRSDGMPIPWIAYGADGKCIADFAWPYGRALEAGDSVRPVEFMTLDGEVRWVANGSESTVNLSAVIDDDLPKAFAAAYSHQGPWIESALRQANHELSRKRLEMPDAGGLVIATDQFAARAYAAILQRLTGESPALVISDEPESSTTIEKFAKSSSRWIVAVRMVSEGVDIPRLAVGVYATNVKTPMFFRQAVGRFIRQRDQTDETIAALFIPAVPPLVELATKIRESVDMALAQRTEREKRDLFDSEQMQPRQFTLFSSEAIHTSTIADGETYTDEELRIASAVMAAAGMPSNVTPTAAAKMLRLAGKHAAGTVTFTPTPDVGSENKVRRSDLKKTLRQRIKGSVGRYARFSGEEYSHIHAKLNKLHGGPIDKATVDQLEARIVTLNEWIEECR
jgi:superfamily II DNA or RNA helicase